jgi:hypothetical protein
VLLRRYAMEVIMDDINKKIAELKDEVIKHHSRLGTESTWLFVASIGCWSITVQWVQILAMGIIFYFLFRNVFDGLNLNSTLDRNNNRHTLTV